MQNVAGTSSFSDIFFLGHLLSQLLTDQQRFVTSVMDGAPGSVQTHVVCTHLEEVPLTHLEEVPLTHLEEVPLTDWSSCIDDNGEYTFRRCNYHIVSKLCSFTYPSYILIKL